MSSKRIVIRVIGGVYCGDTPFEELSKELQDKVNKFIENYNPNSLLVRDMELVITEE